MENKIENKIENAFWTGGWDSTFMIVEQLIKGNSIQPIYIIDPNRVSKEIELNVMEEISNIIKNKFNFKGELLPLKIVKMNEVPLNNSITNAYNKIHKVTHLGTQHDWLARYAFHNKGIMIGTEFGEPETSHIIDSLQRYCILKEENGVKVVDSEKSTEEGNLVLGALKFPIVDKTELQMVELVHEWKIEEIMKKIWFCHNPIDGEPCGICHPCEVKIESNMEFLLSEKAIKRYKVVKKVEKKLGNTSKKIVMKIIRIVKGCKK